ncbi:MAG: hypothetical protein AAF226_16995, partial [Verrucomicrobiota bacterium]
GGVTLQAQVKELEATLYLNQGGNPNGYIQGSNPTAVLFSPTQGVRGQAIKFTDMKGSGNEKIVRFAVRSEVLAEGRGLFSQGKYLEAAQAFGKVAAAYQIIMHIPNNFCTEARYFQIESLRRAGKFSQMAPLMEDNLGKTVYTHLSDRYKGQFEMQKLWALYGKGDIAGLKEGLAVHEVRQSGEMELLPTPNFKDMSQAQMAQLSFMRAKIYEKEGEADKALQDYYRVMTLTFSNDDYLSMQAMGSAINLETKDPNLNSEKAKAKEKAQHKVQMLTYYFGKRFGASKIPQRLSEYNVRPQVPLPMSAPPAEPEAEEAPAEEAAPAEGDAEGAEEKKGKKKKDKKKDEE